MGCSSSKAAAPPLPAPPSNKQAPPPPPPPPSKEHGGPYSHPPPAGAATAVPPLVTHTPAFAPVPAPSPASAPTPTPAPSHVLPAAAPIAAPTISAPATSSEPLKEKKPPKMSVGYMNKAGQVNTAMKRRFFLLKEGQLTYYDKEAGAKGSNKGDKQLGKLDMKGYKVNEQAPSKIVLTPLAKGERTLILELSDDHCRKVWVEAFKEHIVWRDQQ